MLGRHESTRHGGLSSDYRLRRRFTLILRKFRLQERGTGHADGALGLIPVFWGQEPREEAWLSTHGAIRFRTFQEMTLDKLLVLVFRKNDYFCGVWAEIQQ